jgi:hypothetical protein
LRNGAPFKDWRLPGALGHIQNQLSGHADGDRQMVDILNAVLADGLDAVQAACAEALSAGIASADVVLNALARAQEPDPPPSITTPQALTLNHVPAANCARYDTLRRLPYATP